MQYYSRLGINPYAFKSREDDRNWPEPDSVGTQELEVVVGKEHISFTVSTTMERVSFSSPQPNSFCNLYKQPIVS